MADASPDPVSNQNMMISAAYTIEGIPAFIVPQAQAPSRAEHDAPPSAISAGILLKTVEIGQAVNIIGNNGNRPRERVIFADDKTRTLYTSDKDMAGKSNCNGDCATNWPPFTASADAKPAGDWTIITRDDGAKQWAFAGKPMYTYAKDSPGGRGFGGGGAAGHDVEGHHVLELQPKDWMALPKGITAQEVRTASGQVLTTEFGTPIYHDGKVTDTNIHVSWAPVSAPQMTMPKGDFTIVKRADGSSQWAYKGKPLYRFKGDMLAGDSNGIYDDQRFHLVYAMRYFMPSNVAVRQNELYGGLLTTADNRTLYAREIGHDQVDSAIRGERGDLFTGARIGLTGCDAKCEQKWQPFIAPAHAQDSGYWTVYTRPDGKKQWAYFGYALYTLADDKPGEMRGNMLYELVRDTRVAKADAAQVDFGMRWRVAPP